MLRDGQPMLLLDGINEERPPPFAPGHEVLPPESPTAPLDPVEESTIDSGVGSASAPEFDAAEESSVVDCLAPALDIDERAEDWPAPTFDTGDEVVVDLLG